MTLRTRLLLGIGVVILIPIALLAFGLRQEMTRRLSEEYQLRVNRAITIIREDLMRESAGISERLKSLGQALVDDNQFRSAAVTGDDSAREYLLEYAGTAMRLTGLSMLQIQDGDGRIISSGHFRNEHGRIEADLAAALAKTPGVTIVTSRGPERQFLALARAETVVISERPFTLIGGITVDDAFLARLTRDREIEIALRYPGGELSIGSPQSGAAYDTVGDELQIPLIRRGQGGALEVVQAHLQVTHPLTPLRTLLRSVDSWFLGTAAATAITAVLLALWVSARVSRPLAALAEKTAVLDLDRLDVEFDPGNDEVGRLSRLLGDMAGRLRTSTARIREAERRAAVGDLARQINHDIKNGLIPLRNVMRHLSHVERTEPQALPAVFGERRHTVESSIAYLETLATSYQRLSPPLVRRECDLNALIEDVVRAAQGREQVEVDTRLTSRPVVTGDPVALRRILENLIANAVDALQSKPGRVTVSTQLAGREPEQSMVRVTVADTGHGMTPDEAARIFDDFYTTKEHGTGLGLSIVRRLVMDLHGTISVDSAPGKGTRMVIDIPTSGCTVEN